MPQPQTRDHRPPERHSRDQPPKLRFWQIDHVFRCPVVGICLTDAEQELLLKRGSKRPRRETSFDRHEALVAASHRRDALAKRADRLLSEKYGPELTSLDAMPESELLASWHDSLARGSHAPVLWAAATRADLSLAARQEIFASVHMAMHGDAREPARLRAKLAADGAVAKGLRETLRKLSAEIRRLESERPRRERPVGEAGAHDPVSSPHASAHAAARDRRERPRSTPEQPVGPARTPPRSQVRSLERSLTTARSRLTTAQRENAELRRELETTTSRNAAIVRDTGRVLEDALAASACATDCPRRDLCGRRVLIVGGIAQMESLYRSLIEENGGVCEFHDGHVDAGRRELEGGIKRADVVISLADRDNRAASSIVKELGKKHGKPVHVLGGSSLHAVSKAIDMGAAS